MGSMGTEAASSSVRTITITIISITRGRFLRTRARGTRGVRRATGREREREEGELSGW